METGREKFLIWLPVFGYLDKTNRSTINSFRGTKGHILVFVKY